MYMMTFINLPICFITFNDVAVGCSKCLLITSNIVHPGGFQTFLLL